MILLLYVKYPRKTISALILLAISSLFLCSCEGTRSTLLPSISVGETYTDNRDLTHTSQRSDWLSTVSPEITYTLYAPKGEMQLSYNPSFVYYAQGGEGAVGSGASSSGGQFADRQSAMLFGWDKVQMHSMVTFSDSYTRTDDPVAFQEPIFERTNQPLPPVDQTIRTSRQPFDTNFANVAFRQDFGRNDSITFSYTNTYLNNDDPTIPNNVTSQPSADLMYWFNELYGIDLKASYLMGDYSGEELLLLFPI